MREMPLERFYLNGWANSTWNPLSLFDFIMGVVVVPQKTPKINQLVWTVHPWATDVTKWFSKTHSRLPICPTNLITKWNHLILWRALDGQGKINQLVQMNVFIAGRRAFYWSPSLVIPLNTPSLSWIQHLYPEELICALQLKCFDLYSRKECLSVSLIFLFRPSAGL